MTEPEYELEIYGNDMTVRLHKGGCMIAKVTMQEIEEHRQPNDTPEMAFARALSFRRSGYTPRLAFASPLTQLEQAA